MDEVVHLADGHPCAGGPVAATDFLEVLLGVEGPWVVPLDIFGAGSVVVGFGHGESGFGVVVWCGDLILVI